MIYLLSQILDRSAEQFPDHEAFRCDGESLTYGELLRRANGLAHTLISMGVKRGDRVGIYLSKSLESAVAIYGVWKAGAAYVPLDPGAPVARTAYAINHCGIRHLITQKSKRMRIPDLLAASPNLGCVIGLPESFDLERSMDRCDWPDISPSDASPNVRVMEQDLAYIMYTSGSTGTPKGIMHTHRSGLNYARMAAHTYGLTHADRLGNHSPLHFDMSTLDYFSGPLVGATTVIIPEAYTKMPASLSQLAQDEALTIWYSVPFALIQLLLRGVLEERDLNSLRWVLFGGEPYPAKYMYGLMERLPKARFSNVYGPAEINQCSYYHVPPLADGQTIPEDVAPIGQIWANAEEIVVDDQDNPVSSGDVGELLVRTPTMMEGYWQRPDLNESAFYKAEVANQTAVFYRTGDLVQQQPDGNYQFVGRKDRQIKTRGYRVELDEVEAALVGHPQVEEAAAYGVPVEAGGHQVEAAVILKAGVSEGDLLRYVGERLPAYAVPRGVAIALTFPRTGTGKIDRRALQQQAEKRVMGSRT
ncbi:amino acid adenylation domain-containing protein [Leptolyngbya cf. ectocarpi LEGE 11479]|uniref:Amino acid adenylation domain-containing protein n=1 Tax=Leptolyngbya cf. ectocarpi LEGE 11479 TaxID=1828722 RepID=A0A928ZR46_LEPEC|nr:amino acid adenylation domain-containing protein [Leptolyngbya ectocarpi]MBE9066940.1 amino acid adenylation domain-containing protein [Leptolyngbya cf. ectocarpi LEGE 11479]